MQPLIELANIDVALNGTTVLRDITWQLRTGEHWAICGANGSGKSTFLKVLRGDVSPVPKKGWRISRLGGIVQRTAVGLKERIGLVSPEMQDRYLQQEWRLTGLQVLYSGFQNGDYVYQKPTAQQKEFAAKIVQLLGIDHLLSRNVQQISTGELRKLLIGRALAGKPQILALDEACDGLDAPSRADLQQVIERIANSGTQLLLATHRPEEMLHCVTHSLLLTNGRVKRCGGRVLAEAAAEPNESGRELPHVKTPRRACKVFGLRQSSSVFASSTVRRRPRTLLRLEGANVFLEREQVLHDINWQIQDNEHWAILGANGSGKSTLLKLAFGELHAAWGAKVVRFEFTARNTIWDVKRRIGYIAPDLQANYRASIAGLDVIASGFFGTVGLHQRLNKARWRRVHDLVGIFGATDLVKKNVLSMSYGEFRTVLLLRALVHEPEILICDEPFNGLDARATAQFSGALQTAALQGSRVVMVTHHVGEILYFITHGLLLHNGRIILQDRLDVVRAHPAVQRLFARV